MPQLMTFVPSDVEWFIATLIFRIDVEGDRRTVVHRNMVLIEGGDLGTAYARATELGRDRQIDYLNLSGRRVRHSFQGLENLLPVHDKLEHGAEIAWTEHVGLSDEAIKSLVQPRERLLDGSVPDLPDRPDYTSAEVLAEVDALVGVTRSQRTKKK